MHTIKINKKVTVTMPDGSLCESWNDDNDDDFELCQFFHEHSHQGQNDLGSYDHYDCSLFQETLKTEIGVGVYKCKNCVSIMKDQDAYDKN